MFNVQHNECVGFESRWRVKKVSSVGSTQTSEYSKIDMDTNTSEKNSIEIQTESEQASTSSTPHCEVDEEKLAAWLTRIYPRVKKELDDVTNSKAFRGYYPPSDSSDANCKLVQTVDVSSHTKDAQIASQISALSWNSTSQTLAVSCTYKHKSWCYHEGFVAFYSLDRDDNLQQNPRIVAKTETCVTALQFHSVLPAVIAAGLFSGGIIVWNVQEEEEEIVAKIDGHGDGITHLSWIVDINNDKSVNLASSGLDGFLTLWNFSLKDSHLSVKERHQMRSPLFPKSSPDSPDETIKKVIRGVTCFDFSKHTPEMFVVGAEGGLVIQCSLLGTTKLRGSGDSAIPLLDSSFKYYEPHKGEVISVSFSPNRKDMFMTNGSNSEIRIYIMGQEEPAQVIFTKNALNCVTWVPFVEKIICGCGKSGILEIYQVVKGKLIEDTTKEKGKGVMSLFEINKSKTNIVAVGNLNGQIQLWRVPWGLFGNMSVQ